MMDDVEQLVAALTNSPPSNEILYNIAHLLEKQTSDSLSTFVSASFQRLLTIEHWAWQELGNDTRHWIGDKNYAHLLHTLASFNMKLVLSTDIEAYTKSSLLIPETVDRIDSLFDRIDETTTDDDLLWTIASRWLDVLSHLIHERIQFVESPVIVHINQRIGCNFLMTDQFKLYLSQLRESNLSQSIFTPKQLFYMKTCSLSLNVYVCSKAAEFSYSDEQILQYLADDYFQMILVHSYTVGSWSKELLSCIAHLNGVISSCCRWSNDMATHVKILIPCEQTAHDLIQALIRIVGHTPFHERITALWSNDETILISSTLVLFMASLEIEHLSCFIRSKTPLPDILVAVAERSPDKRICVCAYSILSRILSDEHFKQLKIANNICEFYLHILEQAWSHPWQRYQQVPILNLLKGKRTFHLIKSERIFIITSKNIDEN
jgi:hypothetical protein